MPCAPPCSGGDPSNRTNCGRPSAGGLLRQGPQRGGEIQQRKSREPISASGQVHRLRLWAWVPLRISCRNQGRLWGPAVWKTAIAMHIHNPFSTRSTSRQRSDDKHQTLQRIDSADCPSEKPSNLLRDCVPDDLAREVVAHIVAISHDTSKNATLSAVQQSANNENRRTWFLRPRRSVEENRRLAGYRRRKS